MAIASVPLLPKKSGPLRVLTIGRISTVHQQMESIDAMYAVVETQLRQVYKGEFVLTKLGEQASGMLVDRPTIVDAMQRIADGEFDLVMIEDLSRAYRNPAFQYTFVQHCVDNDTRFIALNDNLDTADENWELSLSFATVRHGMHIPDTRKRVKRSATHSFHQGGMVLKVPFGYRKVSKEDALAGNSGPVGLRIAKDPSATPIILKMMDRVMAGDSFEAIVQGLNDEGVLPGPYVKKRRWTAKLLRTFLRMELLHGERILRKVLSNTVYKTGKSRRVPNSPENWERKVYPELAHLSLDEHLKLLEVMDARASNARHAQGTDHPRYRSPRSRTVFPRQHATCGICGALMYTTEGDRIVCSRALAGDCWNKVRPHEPSLRQAVLDAILSEARMYAPFEESLLTSTKIELGRLQSHFGQRTALLEKQLQATKTHISAITTAIAESNGQLHSLLERLKTLEDLSAKLSEEIAAANEARAGEPPVLSDDLIRGRMPELLLRIAAESFDFAEWIRKLIPQLQILPVQALDTALVRSKVRFVVHWSALVDEPVDDTHHLLDVGNLPQHVQDAMTLRKSGICEGSLGQVARSLGMSSMRLKRARVFLRLMQEAGVEEPFKVLTEAPVSASRWRGPKGKQVTEGPFNRPAEVLSSGVSRSVQICEIATVG